MSIGCRIENKGIGRDRVAEQNRRYNDKWTNAGTHTSVNSGWPIRHARAFLAPKAPAFGARNANSRQRLDFQAALGRAVWNLIVAGC